MTKVIIDRTKWSRGAVSANALLISAERAQRNSHEPTMHNPRSGPKAGSMCCLGFACLAVGLPSKAILDKGYPKNVGLPAPGLVDFIQETGDFVNTEFSLKAADINDDIYINDSVRESRLKELAAKHGFEFEFVN